jgi:hypothetical protein
MRFRALNWAVAFFALIFGLGMAAQQPAVFTGQNPALPLFYAENGFNSAHAQRQHYVVLVSLDGFRWDYARRDGGAEPGPEAEK